MLGGLGGAPRQPQPAASDLSAGRLLGRQYEVSGAFEHAPKIGSGAKDIVY
jgi:hypothetical protein